ncbi:cysteine hydrolase family protein [Pseudomonas sp. 10-1B]|uniref:cysteine hydrolase family protein n=1 Tax=Pseudomonas sp. 10-1B TaxID=1546029 RepID=UPI001F23CEE2|nr:isochorismatase family protein [Pseudomonas sp. 10-1B]
MSKCTRVASNGRDTRHVNDAQGRDLAIGEPVDNQDRPITYRADTAAIEVIDALAPKAGDVVIDKQRYSAFHGTRFAQTLKGRGITRLVVVGMLTRSATWGISGRLLLRLDG